MTQTLNIIKKIHKKGYLYRDIKPANFMVKTPYQEIFIIDFGLCKKYLNNNRHITMKANKKLVGTPLFCSLNTHIGLGIQNIMKNSLVGMTLSPGYGVAYFSLFSYLGNQWSVKKNSLKNSNTSKSIR